jgi:predicted O-methyltransferase YrrM
MKFLSLSCKDCNFKSSHKVHDELYNDLIGLTKNHRGHDIKCEGVEMDGEISFTRDFTLYLLNNYINLNNSIGVEIGTLYGKNAYNILTVIQPKMLYLVDPYEYYTGYDCSDFRDYNPEESYTMAKETLKDFSNKTFIRKKTEDAINDIPDNLDFVYIDGNHSYPYVKKDLELMYKKVRSGGLIGGHDFTLGDHTGVCKAVVEFVLDHNIYNSKTKGNDFIIIKE